MSGSSVATDSVNRRSVSDLLQPNLVAAGTLVDLPLHGLLAQGISALVLDVDRTLLPHRGSTLPEPMEAWLKRAQAAMPLHLFSNNPSRSRIGGVAEHLGVNFTTSAGKPRRSPLLRVLQQLDLPAAQVAMVGDRIFTDVLAGNRLGMYTVLVKPIDPRGQPCRHDHWQRFEVKLAQLAGADLP